MIGNECSLQGHTSILIGQGYAELCLFVGDKEEYEHVCDVLLEKFGDTKIAGTAEGVARCCSLLPASDDRVSRAAALADVAFNSEAAKSFWYYRYYVFAKGLNEFRFGSIDMGPVQNFTPMRSKAIRIYLTRLLSKPLARPRSQVVVDRRIAMSLIKRIDPACDRRR